MYFVIVSLLLFVCPALSVVIGASRAHEAVWNLALIGKWWTFWAVGIRLFIAGVRQVVQPRFTAQEIFEIHDLKVFPLVREIGFGNLSMGIAGICTLFRPGWLVPVALVGGLYYGFAGLVHLRREKNATEFTALASDAFASILLLTFVVSSLSG
jgi:hypothetical protein